MPSVARASHKPLYIAYYNASMPLAPLGGPRALYIYIASILGVNQIEPEKSTDIIAGVVKWLNCLVFGKLYIGMFIRVLGVPS